MLYNTVTVHYAEIGTKGKNRSMFENQLIRNICSAMKEENIGPVTKVYGRILVELNKDSNIKSISKKLSKVFGISWFAPAKMTGLKQYNKAAQEIFDEAVKRCRKKKPIFRIHSTRSYKKFRLKSMELNKALADKINAKLKLPVNLSKPNFTVYAEVTEKGIIFFTKKTSGLGGMPVGVSGKVLLLLSGGIDSPVAAYQLMKRGCKVDFVHYFHENTGKIKALKKVLDKYQYKSKLWEVPFKPIQLEIIKHVHSKYRLLIYRRFMFRIAEQIAKKNKHLALATGESIAQVASQTIENISAVELVISMPTFRPLISFDKQEIINIANKIGTYVISIQSYEDCCSFLVPKHPALKATKEELDLAEKKINIKRLLKTF